MKLVFLLALFLLATLPVSAKPELFAVGSFPPDTGVRDSTGQIQHLHALRNTRRIVLLSAQNAAYFDNMRRHQAEFTERDVIVLMTDWPSFQFYLVGKDGHIKMARHTPPTNKELFAVIDAMPMRQAEMQDRK